MSNRKFRRGLRNTIQQMKRLAFLSYMTDFSIGAFAQNGLTNANCFYDGFWGEWFNTQSWNGHYSKCHYKAIGKYNDFIVYRDVNHPSEYYFKLSFNETDAVSGIVSLHKTRNKRLKDNENYKYEGTIEFYLDDKTSNAKEWVKVFAKNENQPYRSNRNIRKNYQCTVYIAPYKDNPREYIVAFNELAIGFTID